MKNNKLVRLIISIIMAIGLWVYVVNVVNPSSTTVIRNVPVSLVGTEQLREKGLAIAGSGEYTVDLTVRASRTDLMVITADNFFAVADVSGLSFGQDYITVEIDAPNGYTVEDIKSRKIQVYVDEAASVTVPVRVECSAVETSYETAVLSVYPEVVEIYGAKQIVEKVDSFVVNLDSSRLSYEQQDCLILEGAVKDSAGNDLKGVRPLSSEITVWASVYSTKVVNFKARYGGEVWPGAVVSSINAPTSVTIKGPSDIISEISDVESEWISIDGIYEDFNQRLVPLLPEGVQLADACKDISLNVDIADNGNVEFIYYVSEIAIANLPENTSVSCSLGEVPYVTATVTGPVGTLKTMSDSDITLSIDAASLKAGAKDAKLNAATQISGVEVSLSPSTVGVEIRKY